MHLTFRVQHRRVSANEEPVHNSHGIRIAKDLSNTGWNPQQMLTEPDVTLTDYGLAIECALFTYLIYHRRNQQHPLRIWFTLFFGSLALSALTGGTAHGFFLNGGTTGHTILWSASIL